MEIDQILMQKDAEEKERMYKEYLEQSSKHSEAQDTLRNTQGAEDNGANDTKSKGFNLEESLEHSKIITIQRNKDKMKEQERNNRLNSFWNAITEFMEE